MFIRFATGWNVSPKLQCRSSGWSLSRTGAFLAGRESWRSSRWARRPTRSRGCSISSSWRWNETLKVNINQCDQIWQFVIQLFCPNRQHILGKFCKGVKIFHFIREIHLGNLFDIWWLFTGHTVINVGGFPHLGGTFQMHVFDEEAYLCSKPYLPQLLITKSL